MMTTVTKEQSGGETPELLVPLPHPSILGAAGGQQLDPIAEESREDQQDASNRSTGEEQNLDDDAQQIKVM